MKKSRLGKGLDALIPKEIKDDAPVSTGVLMQPIEKLKPNKSQPRKSFEDSSIKELSASIKEKGVIQPLIVRKKGDSFEIIAGERRWRASQIAGIKSVPVIMSDADDQEVLELALIENLQREDLNPIEEAEAYQQLINNHGLTHEEISKQIGKDRSTISNQLRLLKLTAKAKEALVLGTISAGHARALVTLESEDEINETLVIIIQRKLSVRQTENLVKSLGKLQSAKEQSHTSLKNDKFILDILEQLKRNLGTKVSISGKTERGKIEIEYFSAEEFDRLIGILTDGR
ncbi:MAG: ParB/RepB/Spo0J family partition protein [Thermodesulfobacteriota bacterium]